MSSWSVDIIMLHVCYTFAVGTLHVTHYTSHLATPHIRLSHRHKISSSFLSCSFPCYCLHRGTKPRHHIDCSLSLIKSSSLHLLTPYGCLTHSRYPPWIRPNLEPYVADAKFASFKYVSVSGAYWIPQLNSSNSDILHVWRQKKSHWSKW